MSTGGMNVVDDQFRVTSEGTVVAAMVMEMGHVNMEVFHGSSQASVIEAEKVQCDCCGLVEECTPAYIEHIQGIYCGRWICGLCSEAVKEERRRSGGGENSKEGLEDALNAHMSVCMQFNNSETRMGSPIADISAAVRRMFRRSTDVRLTSQSAPSSPNRRPTISRANSCFGSLPQGSEAQL